MLGYIILFYLTLLNIYYMSGITLGQSDNTQSSVDIVYTHTHTDLIFEVLTVFYLSYE